MVQTWKRLHVKLPASMQMGDLETTHERHLAESHEELLADLIHFHCAHQVQVHSSHAPSMVHAGYLGLKHNRWSTAHQAQRQVYERLHLSSTWGEST